MALTFERLNWHHQLIFDGSGNLIGVRNPRARGADFLGGSGGAGNFATISGSPYDNLALGTELNARQARLPSGAVSGQVLTWNGSGWVAAAAPSGGGSSTTLANNLTTTTPGVAALDAAQGPVIQSALDGKQARITLGTSAQYFDGTLTPRAFPSFGTVTSVDLSAPLAGITVSGGPVTSSGTIAIGLANDLAAVEALSGTGVAQRTGTDTWALLQLDADTGLTAASDTRIPTQRAVKLYADQIVAANDAMVFRGVLDCSLNPVYPAANTGDTWRVSVAGRIGGSAGPAVELGDLLICLADNTPAGNHATVGASWSIAQSNLDGAVTGPTSSTGGNVAAFSGASGKVLQDGGASISTDGTLAANSDAKLPTEKAVRTYVTGKTYPLVNDDTTGGAGSAWSAERGKVAAANIAANASAIAGKLTAPASPAAGQVITWNGTAWVAQDQNRPSVVIVAASRALAAGDIGSELRNASGAYTLTIDTGLGTDADAIFFAPTGTGSQTVAAGTGVTLYDARPDTPTTVANFSVPANGFAAIERISSTVWRRV